jgi:hypothetical protein
MPNDRLKCNQGGASARSVYERATVRSTDMKVANTEPGRRFSRKQLLLSFVLFNMAAWAIVLWLLLR